MGLLTEFRCPKCRYTARVVGGRGGGAWSGWSETIVCLKCRMLHDMKLGPGAYTDTTPICPHNESHPAKFWSSWSDGCPRCDAPAMQPMKRIIVDSF